ncbi:MAG TPA: hypothetical protein VFL04_02570, partial [Rectinemataceae bacterium]|nr:hypothetical protein [Rectinemataceae bacterium]
FRHCVSGASREALDSLDAILARGVSVEQLVVDGVDYFRSLLLLKHGISRPSLIGAPAGAYEQSVLDALSPEQIERGLASLLELYRNLRSSVEPRFELELTVARLCRLAQYVSQGEVAEVIASLKRRVEGEAGPGAGPAKVGPALPDAAAVEKKKHELPPSLTAAFGSLAAAASVHDGQDGGPVPEAKPLPRPPARPLAMNDDAAVEPERPAEEAAAPEPGAAEAPADDPLRASVIEALGRSSPLLKTGLSASLPWRVEGPKLVIPFRSGIDESVVQGSIAAIASKAGELLGRTVKVELIVEPRSPRPATRPGPIGGQEDQGAEPPADSASVVQRVFRGTLVETRKQGERDEPR